MATAIGVSCLSLGSCNSEDPSAVRENEKALAEATSKVATLEEDVTSLKAENETLTQKLSSSESKAENGLTAAQLDTKLNAMVKPLTEQIAAMEKKLDRVNSLTEKVIAQNDIKIKEAQAIAQRPPEPPPVENREPARPQPPAAAPSKPKPKYDITLDNPVMGPGGR